MGFVALILALVIEQFRPLPRHGLVHQGFIRLQAFVHEYTQTGEKRLAWIAWGALIGVIVLICLALDLLLSNFSPMLELVMHVGVLYVTVGFRQFSHPFSEILKSVTLNDLDRAKQHLETWLRPTSPDFNAPAGNDATTRAEICRIAIGHAMIASHRRVLAPLLWYVLLPGFVGPVLYRCAEYLARAWETPDAKGLAPDHAETAKIAYWVIDWLPLRLSAATFAAVGNFEDAVHCWRSASEMANSMATDDPLIAQETILLSSGSGALGYQVHLDKPIPVEQWNGATPDGAALRSAVALVWRAVVLCIGTYGLMTVAGWIGKVSGLA